MSSDDYAFTRIEPGNTLPSRRGEPITRFDGDYAFLSNFYPSKVGLDWLYGDEHRDIAYPTVEHAYQAAKSLNPDERHQISLLPSPGTAKRAGRYITARPDWDEARLEVMNGLIRYKFAPADMSRQLLLTGDRELIEGNWWGDTYWGCIKVGGEWKGHNHLGKILMEVRREITVI